MRAGRSCPGRRSACYPLGDERCGVGLAEARLDALRRVDYGVLGATDTDARADDKGPCSPLLP